MPLGSVRAFVEASTYTARRALPADFSPFDRLRADQDLPNAFLDESLAQKEAKI